MFETQAMVHSQNALDTVVIEAEAGFNKVTAIYNDVRCTAIFNPFTGLYYVDDVYGVLGPVLEPY